jgi:hypothetical protein
MPDFERRGVLWGDITRMSTATMAAVSLIGGMEPFVQLSQLARWLVEHWFELVADPIQQLLLTWGLKIPAPVVNALLLNVFFIGVLVRSLSNRYFSFSSLYRNRIRRQDRKEYIEKYVALRPVLRQRPQRLLFAGLSTLAVPAILVLITIIYGVSGSAEFLRSFEKATNACFVGRDMNICSSVFSIKDEAALDALGPADPNIGSIVRKGIVAKVETKLSGLGLDLQQFFYMLLAVSVCAVAYLYLFSMLFDKYMKRPEIEALMLSYKPPYLMGIFGQAFIATWGLNLARIFAVALAILALSSMSDALPEAYVRFKQSFGL